MPYSLDPQRSRYIRDSSLVDASADPWASTQRAKMSLTGEFLGPHEKLSVRLGDIIFQREPTIGKPSRWTTILEAQCKKFPDEALIVKIDHVPMTRYPEALTVQKLRAKAVSHEKHNWTLNHLPDLRGFKMKPGPPQDNSVGFRLSQLLREGNPSLRWENPKNPFYYERRTFDRLLQGRLQPLLTLEDQKDTGQVLFDVLQIHRWVAMECKTLHQNLSTTNIMYRIDMTDGNRKIYGVLNDWAQSVLILEADAPYKAPKIGSKPTGS